MEDERWQAVQYVVDSPRFRKSPRLSRLLLYLSEKTLLEQTEFLTEHAIATRVFERNKDFDPGVDTIVRSHMVRLRQKLAQYVEESSVTSTLRVSVPKGEYLVRFERVDSTPEPAVAPNLLTFTNLARATEQESSNIHRAKNPLLLPCWIMVGIIVVLVAALILSHRHPPHQTMEVRLHPLWSSILESSQGTTFVAADNGLVLLHRMTKRNTTLAEYLRRDFSQETHGLSQQRKEEVLNIANRRYTSFVDLNLFRRIQQLGFPFSAKLAVKYARDLHIDELKQGNIILSGARGANPWLELYEPQMNFVGSNDEVYHTYSFINRHPQPGETDQFFVSESDPRQQVLGVLAFISNLDGNGNALVVEGNSMAGTEAISDFLFDDKALLPFLNKLRRQDGTLQHFEVLLQSNSVNGNAGPFHILAYRIHP